MHVGDLVRYVVVFQDDPDMSSTGVVIKDHSPQRPPHVGRVVDVLWSDGEIEEANTNDLMVLNESR